MSIQESDNKSNCLSLSCVTCHLNLLGETNGHAVWRLERHRDLREGNVSKSQAGGVTSLMLILIQKAVDLLKSRSSICIPFASGSVFSRSGSSLSAFRRRKSTHHTAPLRSCIQIRPSISFRPSILCASLLTRYTGYC